MIPKIIHYCWFGGNPLPKLAKKCIKSWKKYCPDYKIIRWDESNFDISSAPLYVRQAYEAKKWAFVTDYIRLQVVYDNGGIYFDTDVEIKKCYDDFLHFNTFFGFELDNSINTGLGFGSGKGSLIIKSLMDDYIDISFYNEDASFDTTPCTNRNAHVFESIGFTLNNSTQVINNNIVFSSEYFCPKNYITGELNMTERTYSIHHFDCSWYNKQQQRRKKAREKMYKKIRRKDKIHIIISKIYRFFIHKKD